MDIKRLKELKQQVFDDFQLYEVKIKMQNSFEESMKEVTPTGEMDEVGNDLTALIDAAIERHSVKSEDVAEAIEQLQSEYVDDFEGYPASCKKWNRNIDLAITAMQQMRKPVEPILDHWAVCPECGYEYILEIMVDYATSDEWIVKYCPECGQPFKYDDQWKDVLVAVRREETI